MGYYLLDYIAGTGLTGDLEKDFEKHTGIAVIDETADNLSEVLFTTTRNAVVTKTDLLEMGKTLVIDGMNFYNAIVTQLSMVTDALVESEKETILNKVDKDVRRLYLSKTTPLAAKASMEKILSDSAEKIVRDKIKKAPFVLHFDMIIGPWLKFKQVYQVDKNLGQALLDTDNFIFRKEMVDNLPYKSFYLEYPFSDWVKGVFVSIVDFDGDKYVATLMLSDHDGKFGAGTCFTDCVSQDLELSRFEERNMTASIVDTDKTEQTLDMGVSLVELKIFVYQFITYLNASNKDVRISKTTKQCYKKSNTIKNRFSEIHSEEVGYVIGPTLYMKTDDTVKVNNLPDVNGADAKSDVEDANYETLDLEKVRQKSISRRPHLIKAHWHNHWHGKVGSPDRKLVPHWHAVTFTGSNTDEITTTVRKVKKMNAF